MAYIKDVPYEASEGPLRELYDAFMANVGYIPESRRVLALRPKVLKNFERLGAGIVRGGSTLGREREDLIHVAVAAASKCSH